jgi:hypothetical protein
MIYQNKQFKLDYNNLPTYIDATQDEIAQVFGNKKQQERKMNYISNVIYAIIDDRYIGINKKEHRDFMRWSIFNDTEMQHGVEQAMIELAVAMFYDGVDLNVGTGEVFKMPEVTMYLKNYELLDGSEKPDVEDGEWNEA